MHKSKKSPSKIKNKQLFFLFKTKKFQKKIKKQKATHVFKSVNI